MARKRKKRKIFTPGMQKSLIAVMCFVVVAFVALIVKIFLIIENDSDR